MRTPDPTQFIKRLIWLYLILLIFEGALRKWVLPGLSNPLLIIRDPVVVLIYFMYMKNFQTKPGAWIFNLILLAVFSFFFGLFSDKSNLMVTLYGLRVNYLHIPLIFIMGNILTRDDVYKIGKFILLLTVPMTLLMILQFYAPYTHFINKKPGGISGFSVAGALGRFRPPGTFSFISGPAAFYPLATAFLINIVIHKKPVKLAFIVATAGAIIIAVPISISRLFALTVATVVAAGAFSIYHLPGLSKILSRVMVISCIILVGLNFLPAFSEGMETFGTRWQESTGDAQGGVQTAIVARFFKTLTEPFELLPQIPLIGYGIGLGSNVGAKLTTGKVGFTLGEYEWTRTMSELGPILGMGFILYRVVLTFFVFAAAYSALKRGNSLPILIFSAVALLLLNGQWAPPTILGFSIMGAGLALGACNSPTESAMQKTKRRRLASRVLAMSDIRPRPGGNRPVKRPAPQRPIPTPKQKRPAPGNHNPMRPKEETP
tara:strand:+ start:14236 stop:15702 length:1467 start_codon:yes stop_codon:yes gene_type:complete